MLCPMICVFIKSEMKGKKLDRLMGNQWLVKSDLKILCIMLTFVCGYQELIRELDFIF